MNGILLNSGFPVGLNGRKYRFFHVGVTLGVTFGVTFLDMQKRKVIKGVTFGVTKRYAFMLIRQYILPQNMKKVCNFQVFMWVYFVI